MVLPIDLGKVKSVAEDIKSMIEVEIDCNIYVDKSCNKDLVSSIKDMFSSAKEVGVNFIDIDDKKLFLEYQPNFAIILAGKDEYCSLIHKALELKNVASFIVTLDPATLLSQSKAQDIKIMKSNLICPISRHYLKSTSSNGDSYLNINKYNSAMDKDIKIKIYKWFYSFADSYMIAYSSKFPFLREGTAKKVISTCSIENAGFGLLNFVPGIDLPLITLNYAKMVLRLAAIYGYKINEDRIPELVALLLTSFAMKYAKKTIDKAKGINKFLLNGTFSYGGTQLLGNIAKSYFASGQAFDGLRDKIAAAF